MIQLEIVTPEKKVFSDAVKSVYLPGEEGEFGVLELHTALVTSLQPGELRYEKDGKIHELAISTGFAEIDGHKVVVLTDSALGEEEIDSEEVEKALARAEQKLAEVDAQDVEEALRLQSQIATQIAKLNLLKKRR